MLPQSYHAFQHIRRIMFLLRTQHKLFLLFHLVQIPFESLNEDNALEQKQSIEFTQYHLKIIRITYLGNVRCLKLGFSHCSYFYVCPRMWHFYRIPHQHPLHILSKLYQWIGMSMPCRGLYHLFPTLKDMQFESKYHHMFLKFLPCDVNLISYCSVTSFKASGFYHYLNATLSTVAINLYYAYKGIFKTYIMIIFCTFNFARANTNGTTSSTTDLKYHL